MKTKWGPIKTAPGSIDILLYRKYTQFVGYYSGADSGWHINAPGVPIMWLPPTHWMPFPEDPEE